MRREAVAGLAFAAALSGCVENTAPGNDREAQLDPPASPAEVVAAEEALRGVAASLLLPEIMTEADQANLPEPGQACRFRMTEVDFPVLAYGSATAVVKLNGKLLPLPAVEAGRYAAGTVSVTIRTLEPAAAGVLAPTEMVLRLADAPNELGFHGFASC